MYSSSYTHVPRYTLEAQKKKQLQRSKGKSCGYYMRIIFFFSSLIQSLIIVSLVLFLVYGKKQDSADSDRIADLEQSFSRLSLDNVALKLQRKNLTRSLNVSTTERLQLDQDLLKMRNLTNTSTQIILFVYQLLTVCNDEKHKQPTGGVLSCPRTQMDQPAECRAQLEHLKAKGQLLQSQLNQTVLENSITRDKLTKERDDLSLEAIDLRNHKQRLEWEIENYRRQCKQDFVASLSGISNVSKAFLEKIDSLFSHHMPFQLSCEKQREHLGQICSNCTTLSRQVEYRFQQYLDDLSTKVNDCVGKTSRLQADNDMKTKKYDLCSHNRTAMAYTHKQDLQRAQLRCDGNTRKLLVEKDRLNREKVLLDSKIRVRETEIVHLKEQSKQLNASCLARTSVRSPSGGSGPTIRNPFLSFPSNFNPDSQRGAGSTLSNKPATNVIGSLNVGITGSTGTDPAKKPSSGYPTSKVQGSRVTGVWPTGRVTSPELGGGGANTVPGNQGLGNLGYGTSSLGRGTGMGLGGGRWTVGLGGGLGANIEQHLQDLQRYQRKPSSTEKKNESPSRTSD